MSSSLEEREEREAAERPREPEVEEAFDRLVSEGGNRLFTENFLVPVTAWVAGRGSWLGLIRL